MTNVALSSSQTLLHQGNGAAEKDVSFAQVYMYTAERVLDLVFVYGFISAVV